ncbi:MAG: hypothetical protein WC462_04915 [archaeon]
MKTKLLFCLFALTIFFGVVGASTSIKPMGYGVENKWMNIDAQQLANELSTNGLKLTHVEFLGYGREPYYDSPSVLYPKFLTFVEEMRKKDIIVFVNMVNWNKGVHLPENGSVSICDSKYSDVWFSGILDFMVNQVGTKGIILQSASEWGNGEGAGCPEKAQRWATLVEQSWTGAKSWNKGTQPTSAPPGYDVFEYHPGNLNSIPNGALITTDHPGSLEPLQNGQLRGYANPTALENYATKVYDSGAVAFIYYGFSHERIDSAAIQAIGRVIAKKSAGICTENNWSSSVSPSTCPSSGQQTKTWSKVGTCTGGVTHPATETISCTPGDDSNPPTSPSSSDVLLGAYPIQIISIGPEKYKQIVLVDAIISDPASSFRLEKAIFDFRNTQSVSSKIINKKFLGRRDNYYPKMNIFTNSVSLAYDKPGNPTEVVIQPRVVGSAIESILYSYMWAHIIGQYLDGENCNTPTSLDAVASSTIYDSEYTAACQEMLAELMARTPTNKPEPDLPPKQTEPAKKWIPSDTVPEEGPKTNITGKDNNAGLTENDSKENNVIHFDGTGTLHTGEEFVTYPNGLIGSGTGGGCGSLDHAIYYIAAQRPPNWESCIEGETCWKGGQDVTLGNLKVLEVTEEDCTQTNISMNGESNIASLTTVGEEVCHGWGPTWYCWDERCTVTTQNEMARILNFQQEKKKAWVGEAVAIEPVEGKVYDLGRYEATPIPEWTNETTLFGEGVGAEWDDGAVLMKNLCINPTGFIPPETANHSGEAYEMEPASDPLVEYGNGGMIKYKLDPNSIPLGVKMYLRGGHVYAEYIGTPQVNSENINFTLRKTNLLGYEYAVLSVKDWIGDTKEEQGFQVKLIGNPSNCYTSDGIAGFTGKEFAPRILFNWDWANIAENQCDARNEDYTYCDATQFTINLFKRLEKIQDLLLQKKLVDLPAKTAFYAYLIKDNYSKEFLDDFSEYYTKEAFANTPLFFTAGGYNKIITGNKIDFNVHAPQATTTLPYGGLYRVEIDINFDNENYMSLMDNNNPIAKIHVSLTPIQPAQNYNAFYETPFDGEVGKKENTYERKNYGASIKSGELILNKENVKAMNYSGAMTELKYSLIQDLNELNKGITLRYKNNDQGKELLFYPSQPTPAMIQITSAGSAVRAEYLMQGNGSDSSMAKEWMVKSSTIGGKNCLDFSNGKSLIFKETISGVGRKLLSWPNATKTGVMELVTTFFTPKTQTDITKAAPVDVSVVKLMTSENYPSLNAGQAIILNYLDVAGVTDYDTLQGMFDRVANKQMCMSKNSSEELLLWWNPDYLEKQIEEIDYDKSHECD